MTEIWFGRGFRSSVLQGLASVTVALDTLVGDEGYSGGIGFGEGVFRGEVGRVDGHCYAIFGRVRLFLCAIDSCSYINCRRESGHLTRYVELRGALSPSFDSARSYCSCMRVIQIHP